MFGDSVQKRRGLCTNRRPRRELVWLGEDFDGEVAPELPVAGAVDFAHAAGREGGDDVEPSESRAGLESHLGEGTHGVPLLAHPRRDR